MSREVDSIVLELFCIRGTEHFYHYVLYYVYTQVSFLYHACSPSRSYRRHYHRHLHRRPPPSP